MTPEEIKIERKRLDERRAALRGKERILRAEVENLQDMCSHPSAYGTSHTGEKCRDCPDCGGCGI